MVKVIKEGSVTVSQEIGATNHLYESRKAGTLARYAEHKRRLEELRKKGLYDGYIDKSKRHRGTLEKIAIRKTLGKKFYNEATPKEFLEMAMEYFKSVDSHPLVRQEDDGKVKVSTRRPYTVEGLCNFVGLSVYMFRKMLDDASMGEFHEAAKMVNQLVIERVLEGGLLNDYNSRLVKFYLENISGLRDGAANRPSDGVKNVTFISVGSRDEAKAIVDIEAEEVP